jgi:hypothetical protein
MSDESAPTDEPALTREPTSAERQLIALLAERAKPPLSVPPRWLDDVLVMEMADGRMGSLRLILSSSAEHQQFGATVAEYSFEDEDGMSVLVSLNVDSHGLPFELDVWKKDFSPLIRLPTGK